LIALVRQLIAENAGMKTRSNRNSSNSSTPPSANPYNKQESRRKKSGKKSGGQPRHKEQEMSLPHAPERTITLEAEKRVDCGTGLEGVNGHMVNTRYKIDFEVKTIAIAYYYSCKTRE
jgi:transposase